MNSDELVEIIPADANGPRIKAAVKELQAIILQRFPLATFEVVHRDDPDGIYLIATVDTDDLDDVIDTVLARMVDMQVEEGLPVYVVPDWPDERVRAQLRQTEPKPVSSRVLATIASMQP